MNDRTHDGKGIRILTPVNEFTWECMAIGVAGMINADDVLEGMDVRDAWFPGSYL